jgi:hypothetical protein
VGLAGISPRHGYTGLSWNFGTIPNLEGRWQARFHETLLFFLDFFEVERHFLCITVPASTGTLEFGFISISCGEFSRLGPELS